MSTGEASGDFLAAELGKAIRELEPDVALSGSGSEQMRAAGFHLQRDTRGWASLGPIHALRRIPPLWLGAWRTALALRRDPFDLVILVDFGAYNLRFAKCLRMLGYRRPLLYYFPPGAWLDREKQARAVARRTTPLTAFTHQRDFYRALGLEIAWFGHPLVSLIEARPARARAPAEGGTVALLPGSRSSEIERHLAPFLGACRLLRVQRPALEVVVGAAHRAAERRIAAILAGRPEAGSTRIVRGARAALENADAALVASGTAVLEAALLEVPSAVAYIVGSEQVPFARRIYERVRYIALPNLLLGRAAVPEILQDDATPARLSASVSALLSDPSEQLADLRRVRATLGPADAQRRCAEFALELARSA